MSRCDGFETRRSLAAGSLWFHSALCLPASLGVRLMHLIFQPFIQSFFTSLQILLPLLCLCPSAHFCVPVHLFTCLPALLGTCVPAHLCTRLPVHLCTSTPAHLSTSLPFHLHTCVAVYLYTCLPVYMHSCIQLPVRVSCWIKQPLVEVISHSSH